MSGLYGRSLAEALTEQPKLVLSWYSYGIMMRKCEDGLASEYPIDPTQLAIILSNNLSIDTGLMTDDILMIRQTGVEKIVVGYRKGLKTGIFMDDEADALRLPLPPLVMIRKTREGDTSVDYRVYAVKKRPTSMDIELFHSPLPNVFNSGAICWGKVNRVSRDSLKESNLAEDWKMLLGSPFGSHAVSGKSQKHRMDVRHMLRELHEKGKKTRRYPISDLVSTKQTLGKVVQA